MTVIETRAQMDAVPVGQEIQVTQHGLVKRWLHTEQGWSDGTSVLESQMFNAAITAGRVVDVSGMTPQVGDWFVHNDYDGRYTRVVVEVTSATQFQMASFSECRNLNLHPLAAPEMGNGWSRVPEWEVTPWQKGAAVLAGMIGDLRRENMRLSGLVNQQTVWPENFVSGLHDLLDAFDDDDDRGRVNDYLDSFGIAKTVEHRTAVRITGDTYFTISASDARRELGDDFEITDVEDGSRVYWQRTVYLTNEGVGCTCDQVERDDLDDYLPDDYNNYDWTTECD